MTRGWALVSVFALFLSGLSVGALGMHLYHASRGADPPRAWAPWQALDLTPEQQRQIAEIVEESHRESEAIRHDLGPRLRQQVEATRTRIRALLTEEQRARLDALEREHRRRMHRLFLGDGPRRHGPGPPRP